jgi:hypothetical protein
MLLVLLCQNMDSSIQRMHDNCPILAVFIQLDVKIMKFSVIHAYYVSSYWNPLEAVKTQCQLE